MSLHIGAKKGDVAEVVLLPGDPLRAKFIAENFLEGAKEYTHIRGILGYTGSYKGTKVSVQGTGMGIPSISIYAEELITEYGAERLIRTGTCGGMQENVHLRDIIIAQGASTDSAVLRNTFGSSINFAPIASYSLLEKGIAATRKLDLPVKVGNVISVDRFYDEEIDNKKLAHYGILAVEMEAAGLYLVAAKYGREALAIFTVSDHIFTHESSSSEEREKGFTDMMKIALETAVA